MKVYPEQMKKNMELSGKTYLSQKIMLALVEKGLASKEDAYKIVQECSMKVLDGEGNFDEVFNKTIQDIDLEVSDESYIQHVDYIFDQIFGEE